MEVEEWLNGNQFSIDIWKKKYQYNNETLDEWFDRVSGGDEDVRRLIVEKKFLFAGRVLANRGLQKYGKRIVYNNCFVLPSPEDNLESIFDTAKYMARIYSTGGGVGFDISSLCPNGSKVNNAAEFSSGPISFADLYNLTTDIISQSGRRGALLLALRCDHPDIEEFITVKSDLNKLTKANISVKFTDDFFNHVLANDEYIASFTRISGQTISKKINAKNLYTKFIENNYNYAEPGIMYVDRIDNWNLLSEDFNYKIDNGNPCNEAMLPAFGACNLGSFCLSAYVKDNEFDFVTFIKDIPIAVKAMNDILDESVDLLPLQEQKEVVTKWRILGLGIMGLADVFIKLGIKYGSEESIKLSDEIGFALINNAVLASAMLAKEYGTFPAYNYDAISKSKFYTSNICRDVQCIVEKYGLRNGQLLSIAPNGTISNLISCNGGLEPIYATSYNRKTESLNNESTTYKIYTPVINELIKSLNIVGDDKLPDYVICSKEIPYMDRIKIQSIWQSHVDSAISSTVNLPNSATQKDIYNLYIEAWKAGLKGITVYRDGCSREGILSTNTTEPITNELKRGDWKPLAEDTIGDKPIKLRTGCGKLVLFPQWSEKEQKLQEVWIKKIGKGGCGRSLDAIAIEMSGMLRLGGSLENVKKAFEGLEICPSFSNAKEKGKSLSPGTSCADCILKALQKYEIDKKKNNTLMGSVVDNIAYKNSCPECGTELIATGGCWSCSVCGYSKCE